MSNPINPNPENALPHVVTALITKRTELAGRIEHLQGEVVSATVELDHIDASLRIFAPNIDSSALGSRPVPPAHHAFRGEVSRILLEALRKSDRPLSTTDLTEHVMQGRGLNMKDARLRQTMGKRVGARSITGGGSGALWNRSKGQDRFCIGRSNELMVASILRQKIRLYPQTRARHESDIRLSCAANSCCSCNRQANLRRRCPKGNHPRIPG